MSRFSLNNKVVLALLIVGMVLFAAYQKFLQSTPEDVGSKFFKTYGTSEMKDVLSKDDKAVFEKSPKDFLAYSPFSLVKIPAESVVLKEIIEGNAGSKKMFYEVDGRKIGLLIVDEGNWKVDADLERYEQIYRFKEELQEASVLGEEQRMLEAYNQLNLVDPQPEYEENIKVLAEKLQKAQELRDYVKSVIVSNITHKNQIVSAFIQNIGRKNLTKVEARIEVKSKDGKTLADTTEVIFERVLGSRLYKDAIPGGYERKVSFDLSTLPMDTSNVNVFITPVAVDYE